MRCPREVRKCIFSRHSNYIREAEGAGILVKVMVWMGGKRRNAHENLPSFCVAYSHRPPFHAVSQAGTVHLEFFELRLFTETWLAELCEP